MAAAKYCLRADQIKDIAPLKLKKFKKQKIEERDRKIMMLFRAGYRYETISQKTDISLSTVKRTISELRRI
jgi:DNA-binding NarL/FixJ family response regulator